MSELPTQPLDRDVESVLKGHPYKAIIRLAWPATIAMLLQTVLSITDVIWVGRLGAAPIAAVISSSFITWILHSLIELLAIGVVALVARAIGAGDYKRASAVADETFRFTLIYSIILTIAGLWARGPLFDLMDLEPEVTRLGEAYMGVYFSAAILMVIYHWISALFRASGNTRIPLMIHSIAIVVNVVIDPVLIFGLGPFPRWGSTGAAVATAFAYGVGCTIAFVMLRQNRLPFRVNLRLWGVMDWKRIGRLVMIGLPISISGMVFSVVYLFVNRITAQFGTPAVAALGIGNRIESINYLVAFGFSTATATLVGQNLGAQNPERAADLTRKTLKLVTAFTGAMTVLFLLFPEQIMHIFVDDQSVLIAGKNYVRILALSQIMMAWEIVYEGAFSGAGDTLPPMVVAIPGAVLRVPLAWFLAVYLGWGIDGVWWTITSSTILKGIALYIWFSLGHWKKREVS